MRPHCRTCACTAPPLHTLIRRKRIRAHAPRTPPRVPAAGSARGARRGLCAPWPTPRRRARRRQTARAQPRARAAASSPGRHKRNERHGRGRKGGNASFVGPLCWRAGHPVVGREC
eukprot:6178014-Pleurochrysis_carterae.AAC.1